MSDPTYRIDVSHEPDRDGDPLPWIARITRLSSEQVEHGAWGITAEVAVQLAQEWIALQTRIRPSQTFYSDDYGNLVEGQRMSTDFPGQPFGRGDTISVALCSYCGGTGEHLGEPCPPCGGPVEGHSVKA